METETLWSQSGIGNIAVNRQESTIVESRMSLSSMRQIAADRQESTSLETQRSKNFEKRHWQAKDLRIFLISTVVALGEVLSVSSGVRSELAVGAIQYSIVGDK